MHSRFENPESSRDMDKEPMLIRYGSRYIPFTNSSSFTDNPLGPWKIIAAGKRQRGQANHPSNPMNNVILIQNNQSGDLYLWGVVYNSFSKTYDMATSNLNGQNRLVYLGRNLSTFHPNMNWIRNYFGMELSRTRQRTINVNAIAWVKNLCLDNRNVVRWEFNKDTKKDYLKI